MIRNTHGCVVRKSKKYCTLLLIAFLVFECDSYAKKIEILERGTKNRISNASVFLLPEGTEIISDSLGMLEIDENSNQKADPNAKLIINLNGYEKYEQSLSDLLSSKQKIGTIYLEKSSYQVFETTVSSARDKRDASKKTLSGAVARQLPGSVGDPVRAVQNLPGVGRPPGLGAQIVIQGAAPGDTSYMIDGHEVPIIFHFAGLSSVVFPEAVDRLDYLSAGYASPYGRAVGGLVGVWTKRPDQDKTKGFVYVDLLNSGGSIEGKVGERGSYFFGIRKSYVGTILKKIAENSDSLNLTAAPNFDDATFIYERPLSQRLRFKMANVVSQDTLSLVLKDAFNDDPNLKGNFSNRTAFFRILPQLTYQISEKTVARASLGLGKDWVKFVFGQDYFKLNTKVVTARSDIETKHSDRWTSIYGMDHRLTWAHVSLTSPNFVSLGGVGNPIDPLTRDQVNIRNATAHNLGAYSVQELTLDSSWTLRPGLRFDYFNSTQEFHISPRPSVDYRFNDYRSLNLASGLYYQPPTPQESSAEGGNPDISSPRSRHVSLQYKEDFRRGRTSGVSLETGPFFRYTDRVVVPSSNFVVRDGVTKPELFNNSGVNRAYGLQSQIKYQYQNFQGWVSYTILQSRSRSDANSWNPAEFDQTHNLTLLGGYEFSKNRRVSSRFRYVTGNPFTPVVDSTFDADQGTFIPTRGAFYSQRVKPFWSLDVRYDKKWIYDRWILSFYIDIQNVLNRKNVESVSYSYDYRQRQDIMGLPILPTLGLKGEF